MKKFINSMCCLFLLCGAAEVRSDDAYWFDIGTSTMNNDVIGMSLGYNWMRGPFGVEVRGGRYADVSDAFGCGFFGSNCDERLTVKETALLAKYGLNNNQLIMGLGVSMTTFDHFDDSLDEEVTGIPFSVTYRTKSWRKFGFGVSWFGDINGEDNYTGISLRLELGKRYSQ